jgi:hypothetical protein
MPNAPRQGKLPKGWRLDQRGFRRRHVCNFNFSMSQLLTL